MAFFPLITWGSAVLSCPRHAGFCCMNVTGQFRGNGSFGNPICSVTVAGKAWQSEGECALPHSNACSPSLTSKLLLNLITGVAGMLQCERAAAPENICCLPRALHGV